MAFEESKKYGEYGEHAVWNILSGESWVRSIVDVRQDEGFREQDVDFLVENLHRQFAGVEVKTDFKAHETGNLVYELTTSGHIGCFEKTKAKFIAYIVPKSRKVYWISVNALRDYTHNGNLKEIRMGDNATGFLIPLEDLIRNGVIMKTYEGVM